MQFATGACVGTRTAVGRAVQRAGERLVFFVFIGLGAYIVTSGLL